MKCAGRQIGMLRQCSCRQTACCAADLRMNVHTCPSGHRQPPLGQQRRQAQQSQQEQAPRRGAGAAGLPAHPCRAAPLRSRSAQQELLLPQTRRQVVQRLTPAQEREQGPVRLALPQGLASC